MSPRPPVLAPCIYYARWLRTRKALTLDLGNLAQATAYVLYESRDGTIVLERNGQTARLAPGEVALAQPGTIARFSAGAHAGLLAFDLVARPRLWIGNHREVRPGTQAQPSWREIFEGDLDLVLPDGMRREARRVVQQCIDRYWRDPLSLQVCEGSLHALVVQLAQQARLRTGHDEWRAPEAIARADNLMFVHARQGLSVARLSEAVGLSRSAFSRRFRQLRNETPGRRLRRLQLQEACRLLLEGTAPLPQIAEESGLGDVATLHRQFRRAFDCTPTAWRRAHRGGSG